MKSWVDIELCKREALKYNKRIDFLKNSKGAYERCRLNGWLDEVCSHMSKPPKKWTYERCEKVIKKNEETRKWGHLKYNSSNSPVFNFIKENEIKEKDIIYKNERGNITDVDDVKNLEKYYLDKYVKRGYIKLNGIKTGNLGGGIVKWTKDKCIVEFLKYGNKGDFREKCPSAYNRCVKQGWLDEIYSSVEMPIEYKFSIYENCKSEAKKYASRKEFKDKSSSGYYFAYKNKWLDIFYPKPDYKKLTKEAALKYKTKKEFRENDRNLYDFSYRYGWLEENCKHMDGVVYEYKYTKEECIKEALKYTRKNHFKRNSRAKYITCVNNGWLDEVSSHFEVVSKPLGYWTKKKCYECALEHDNIKSFKLMYYTAFEKSKSKGWLEEITSHMKN